MSKKKLGNNPFDNIDILKGPARDTSKNTGKNTSKKTSDYASINTSNYTREKTSINTSKNTSVLTKKPEPVKMTFYFYPGQLKELDRLSKKTGRPKTELIRLALDWFFEQVNS